MPGKIFAFLLLLTIPFSASVFAQSSGEGMSRSMEQAIRLYRAGETTEAMDRFMDILIKGSPTEKALANEYISRITIGMNTGVTGVNDDDNDAGLAAVKQQTQAKKSAATGVPDSQTYSPEQFSDTNSAARKEVIAKRVNKALEDLRNDVILKLSNIGSVKLYTKNGQLTALSMNSNAFFAGDTAFKSGTDEALSLISGLIFSLGKVSCLILPEGSVGGDIKIKNIRRAIALNSYFEKRGISKAKIDVDLVGNDISIPKELANVGGLIILFDYTKEPKLKPADDNLPEKGPKVSLGVYPTAIAPHKNEGAVVEFSIMEPPAGIPSWTFQIYQAQPDGSRLLLQEIRGTGAQYNQSYWNGRRNFFGVPYAAGRYIFSITARDIEGNESKPVSRYVQIQPNPAQAKSASVEKSVTLKQMQQKTQENEYSRFKNVEMDAVAYPAKSKATAGKNKYSKKNNAKNAAGRNAKKNTAAKKPSTSGQKEYKVYFQEKTANLSTSGKKVIASIADELSANDSVSVKITGYASSNDENPQSLADERSNFVADTLADQYGIDASRIDTATSVSDSAQNMASVEIVKK